jgi:TolB protein
MDIDGSHKTKITNFEGSKTDAVFTSDGQYIIYSADNTDIEFASIFKSSISDNAQTRLTNSTGYDGAPSISPDGKRLVFESSGGDPEKSSGTSLWILNL